MLFVNPSQAEKANRVELAQYIALLRELENSAPIDLEFHGDLLEVATRWNHAFYDHAAERWWLSVQGRKWLQGVRDSVADSA